MTELAPHPGAALGDELARLMRVMHAFKIISSDGSGPDARERAAHLLLFPLTQLGPVRQGALAEAVHADASTISRHVALLVDRGLVRRIADERDGRASRLIVTPAGEAALERLREERNAHLARATAGWTPAELDSFSAGLQRFVQDLTDYLPTPGSSAGGADDRNTKEDR